MTEALPSSRWLRPRTATTTQRERRRFLTDRGHAPKLAKIAPGCWRVVSDCLHGCMHCARVILTPGANSYAPEVHRASSYCTMVARGTTTLMTPETVARIAEGLDATL